LERGGKRNGRENKDEKKKNNGEEKEIGISSFSLSERGKAQSRQLSEEGGGEKSGLEGKLF